MTRQVSLKLYLSIIATGLMAFSGVLIETAMNVTFPVLMDQFHVDTATVQWLTAGYLLVVSIIVPISGFLKRRFTTKQLFLVANLFFIIGLVICTTVNSFGILLIGRLIQGCGTGIALPLMFNIILEQAPLDKIGFLMGMGTLVTAIAPALGPTYGGLLVGINWHLVFGILLIVMVISLGLGIFSITQVAKTRQVSLDWSAWIAIGIFFAGAIIGFNQIASSLAVAGIAGIIGVAGLIAFVWRSLKSATPLIKLAVFKNPAFDCHLVSFLIFQIMNVGPAFVLPNYLQLVTGTSSLVAGMLLLPGAALGAMLAPISGTIYDRLGAKRPIFVGLTIQLLGILLLFLTAQNANTMVVLAGYILMMLGTGFGMSSVMTNGLAQISKASSVDGNSAFNTLQQFAGALGTAVVSLIVAMAQVKSDYAHTTAIGSQHAFLLLLILEVVNIVVIWVGLRLSQPKRTQKND